MVERLCDCQASYIQSDSNILIVRDHSGGKAYASGKYSVSSAGNTISEIPKDYNKYLLKSEYPQVITTVLEEIGHNLQINDAKKDYHYERTGRTLEYGGNDYITAIDPPEGKNECDEDVEPEDGMAHTWSACTVNDYWY